MIWKTGIHMLTMSLYFLFVKMDYNINFTNEQSEENVSDEKLKGEDEIEMLKLIKRG